MVQSCSVIAVLRAESASMLANFNVRCSYMLLSGHSVNHSEVDLNSPDKAVEKENPRLPLSPPYCLSLHLSIL